MKIGAKLYSGFSAVLVLTVLVAGTSYMGLGGVQSAFQAYMRLGGFDEGMNEGVLQKLLQLDTAIVRYQVEGTERSWSGLDAMFQQTTDGVKAWSELVQEEPELLATAQKTENQVGDLRDMVDQYALELKTLADLRARWNDQATQARATLNTAMEEVIDPAKEEAEAAENVAEMVRWGAIDMVMNEAVIQRVLLLQTAGEVYAMERTETGWVAYQETLKNARAGLTEWRAALVGESAMLETAGAVSTQLDLFAETALQRSIVRRWTRL